MIGHEIHSTDFQRQKLNAFRPLCLKYPLRQCQHYSSTYCPTSGIQINILLSNILILPISISILVFDLAAISILILKNWWQYIVNILIKQYIAHFMVNEKIFQMFFLDFFIFRARLTENVKFESMSPQLATLEIIKTIQIHI